MSFRMNHKETKNGWRRQWLMKAVAGECTSLGAKKIATKTRRIKKDFRAFVAFKTVSLFLFQVLRQVLRHVEH